MKNRLYIFTLIMMIISILISVFFIIECIVFIFKAPFIPPIVFSSIACLIFILLTFHYKKCLKFLKNDVQLLDKVKNRIYRINLVISIISLIFSISIDIAIIFSIIYGVDQWIFYVLFLCFNIISILYFVNTILINKRLN